MKHLILLIFIILTITMMSGCEVKETEEPIIEDPIDIIPKENPVKYDLIESSFGFSALTITDRSLITENYDIVNNEIEFLDALMDTETKIIEITHDLNLGSIEVSNMLTAQSKNLSMYSNVFRPDSKQPLTHPTLIDSGIGLIRIIGRNNLTIFSKTGITIKHASFNIDDSSDIIIRNLHFSELWEWDELNLGTYKRNDWDYFEVEKSNGIWFDHLTFDQAYDGIIDVKEYSSNLTLSWSKLNFVPNAFIEDQISYLEMNQSLYPFYKSLRDADISTEDIVKLGSYQKKGFNLGNTTDGIGFESITMTFHHLEVFNLMDRMPRIRKGDAHVYQIIVDNEDLYQLRLNISHPSISMVNQGIITTEQGAVLMENSVYKYVSTPIKNHQDDDPDVKYTGKYEVINSEWIMPNRTFFGSSSDAHTLWVHSGPDSVIPFELRNHPTIPYFYELEDLYYLPETFTKYPTGSQKIDDFNWLYINTNPN
ncbi:MAG: hypothetical protein K9L02_00110 [Acholeplasmataceae bacterium]|nr:hypothetical protein [Acholeplasmataceae bacterium]